jgi:branched-chain amino acid transport system substrate-binding protein
MHFPAWSVGPQPELTYTDKVFDAVASAPKPPKTVAIVTSKFPSVHFLSVGARAAAKKRGLQEVLWLEWEFGARDFGPIASRIKEANPDFLWIGAIGVEGMMLLEAAKKIEYSPALHFHLYPSPGPMTASPDANHALAATIFEQHAPFTDDPTAAEFVKLFNERAGKAGLPDTSVETQAAASYVAWQLLEAAVTATKSLDDKVLADWLKKNRVKTIIGELRFDGPNNYGDDLMRVKQLQDGKWLVVWPKDSAAPGAKLVTRQ